MKLTVVIADTWSTTCRLEHENEWTPYKRRTVQIELTPEQEALLELRVVGLNKGTDIYEDILQCWFEPAAASGSASANL